MKEKHSFSVRVMLLVTLPHPPHTDQCRRRRRRRRRRTPPLPHRRHPLPPRYILLASSVGI